MPGGQGHSSMWVIVVDGAEAVVVFQRHKRQCVRRLPLPAGGLGEGYGIAVDGGLHMAVAPGPCPRAVGHDPGDDILKARTRHNRY